MLLEIITSFSRTPSGGVRARNRVVEYEAPTMARTAGQARGFAALRDLAFGRAVSFFDYDWTLEKADAGNAMSSTLV